MSKLRDENEQLQKRLNELEREVTTNRVLLNEVQASMHVYKDKY